jgi:protein-S-isoprenylcysteine O-methyltransferase Ste14
MTVATRVERVTAWRHARAIALLPFMNTVMIPGALLAAFPPALPLRWGAAAVAATLAGTALLTAGIALVAHSIRLFVRLGQGTLAPWDPTRELVSAGAYGYSRNPMKGGLFFVLAGEALLTRSPVLAAWLALFALVNVLYIRLHEEPRLEARFGDRYRDYSARVPRWWPRLRSLRHRSSEVNAA